MGRFDWLFGNKKKNSLKMASDAIDFVKLGLLYYLLPECCANFEADYAETLATAVVNVVFFEIPSNNLGKQFLKNKENMGNIDLVIKNSILPEEKLKQIITDAVRVKCILAHGLNPKLSENEFLKQCKQPIENIKQLQILKTGGEMPELGSFVINASSFLQACQKDYELKNKNV